MKLTSYNTTKLSVQGLLFMPFDVFQGRTLTARAFFSFTHDVSRLQAKAQSSPHSVDPAETLHAQGTHGGCMKREGLHMDNMRNEPFSVHPRFSTDIPERPHRARSHTTGGTSTRPATASRPQLARSCPSIASLDRHPPPKQSPLQHLEGGAVALPHRPPARQQA